MSEKRQDIIDYSSPQQAVYESHPQWLKKRLDWFMDQKFGLILHWGPYCQWDCCESWGLVPEDTWARNEEMKCWIECEKDLKTFNERYFALNRTFNPTKFDPEKWAEAAKLAGIKYVCFTTKHHDGFCMWDTKTTNYKITDTSSPFSTNPKADIVREVFDAFRKRGIAISCYFSKSDWHCPYYWAPEFEVKDRNPNYNTADHPEIWGKFVKFVHEQIRELMTNYGQIDMLWLDGGQVCPPDQDIDMEGIAKMARELQPGLIIADRTVGGTYENIITPEGHIPDEPLGVPWESCLPVSSSGWKYAPGRNSYKPAEKIIDMLIDTITKGGNLLIGIGPTTTGVFEDEAIERFKEVGQWMNVNNAAIFGTREIYPYTENNLRFSHKNGYIYIFITQNQDGKAPKGIKLSSFIPAAGSEVEMLGVSKSLNWKKRDGEVIIDLPVDPLPCKYIWVVKFAPA